MIFGDISGFAQFATEWIDFFWRRKSFLKIVIDENRLGRVFLQMNDRGLAAHTTPFSHQVVFISLLPFQNS